MERTDGSVFLVIGLNHGQKKGYSKYGLNHTNLLLLLLTAGACLVANLICSNNQAGMMGRPMNARAQTTRHPSPPGAKRNPTTLGRAVRERDSRYEKGTSRGAPRHRRNPISRQPPRNPPLRLHPQPPPNRVRESISDSQLPRAPASSPSPAPIVR
jgi:hypothetical protein